VNVLISDSPEARDSEHGDQATYYIVNVQTGDYATQLSNIDRLEVVTTNEKCNRHSQVNTQLLKLAVPSELNTLQWFLTSVKRDEYKIHNREFRSFACYDNRPQATDSVLTKRDVASVWRIRPIPGPNAYYT
jgi:hypothetical protein